MKLTVGLAVGRGTGSELASVFERTLEKLGDVYSVETGISRSERIYHSYSSLFAEGGLEQMRSLTEADAKHYELFCREQAARGIPAVFRTAINAQSLYLVRQRLCSVKVEALNTDDLSFLLIRDQAQGFYTGDNAHSGDTVTRTLRFSKEITEKVISYAIDRARSMWPDGPVERILMVYKFHLLDGVLSAWTAELSTRYGVDIELCQPDTANRNLVTKGFSGRVLMVAGNEWADIMHVILLDRLGLGLQENRFTENVYLHPELSGLVEYQTVHGSADDIAGKDIVNPQATIRAAAAIMERHGGCVGAVQTVDRVLASLSERRILTPDQGGCSSTESVIDAFIGTLEAPAACGVSIPL
jgi:isocitrate/isopropylmalate dehydrogenase